MVVANLHWLTEAGHGKFLFKHEWILFL